MNTGTRRLEAARKFILANWRSMNDAEMSRLLDLSIVSVRRLRYKLGLIRKLL